MTTPRFITTDLQLRPRGHRTDVWVIRGLPTFADDGVVLGKVYWWTHWRRYIFAPAPDVVLDVECLLDIAQFCGDQTVLRKEARAAERAKMR